MHAPHSHESYPRENSAEWRTEERCGGRPANSLPGGARQFPPGDELYILILEQLAEFGASEEIEIALAPGGAPGVTLARSGCHFVIGEGQVDNKFGDAGLKILEGGLVEIGPLFRWDGGIDGNGVVKDDVSGSSTGFQIGVAREPIARDENRQLVIVREAQNDFEQVFAIFEKTILVGIEMGGSDAHDVSAIDLRAELQLDFFRIDLCGGRPVVMEITVLVDQAREPVS